MHGINLKCTHEAKGQPTILVPCYKLNHAKRIMFQRGVIQNMASTEYGPNCILLYIMLLYNIIQL